MMQPDPPQSLIARQKASEYSDWYVHMMKQREEEEERKRHPVDPEAMSKEEALNELRLRKKAEAERKIQEHILAMHKPERPRSTVAKDTRLDMTAPQAVRDRWAETKEKVNRRKQGEMEVHSAQEQLKKLTQGATEKHAKEPMNKRESLKLVESLKVMDEIHAQKAPARKPQPTPAFLLKAQEERLNRALDGNTTPTHPVSKGGLVSPAKRSTSVPHSDGYSYEGLVFSTNPLTPTLASQSKQQSPSKRQPSPSTPAGARAVLTPRQSRSSLSPARSSPISKSSPSTPTTATTIGSVLLEGQSKTTPSPSSLKRLSSSGGVSGVRPPISPKIPSPMRHSPSASVLTPPSPISPLSFTSQAKTPSPSRVRTGPSPPSSPMASSFASTKKSPSPARVSPGQSPVGSPKMGSSPNVPSTRVLSSSSSPRASTKSSLLSFGNGSPTTSESTLSPSLAGSVSPRLLSLRYAPEPHRKIRPSPLKRSSISPLRPKTAEVATAVPKPRPTLVKVTTGERPKSAVVSGAGTKSGLLNKSLEDSPTTAERTLKRPPMLVKSPPSSSPTTTTTITSPSPTKPVFVPLLNLKQLGVAPAGSVVVKRNPSPVKHTTTSSTSGVSVSATMSPAQTTTSLAATVPSYARPVDKSPRTFKPASSMHTSSQPVSSASKSPLRASSSPIRSKLDVSPDTRKSVPEVTSAHSMVVPLKVTEMRKSSPARSPAASPRKPAVSSPARSIGLVSPKKTPATTPTRLHAVTTPSSPKQTLASSLAPPASSLSSSPRTSSAKSPARSSPRISSPMRSTIASPAQHSLHSRSPAVAEVKTPRRASLKATDTTPSKPSPVAVKPPVAPSPRVRAEIYAKSLPRPIRVATTPTTPPKSSGTLSGNVTPRGPASSNKDPFPLKRAQSTESFEERFTPSQLRHLRSTFSSTDSVSSTPKVTTPRRAPSTDVLARPPSVSSLRSPSVTDELLITRLSPGQSRSLRRFLLESPAVNETTKQQMMSPRSLAGESPRGEKTITQLQAGTHPHPPSSGEPSLLADLREADLVRTNNTDLVRTSSLSSFTDFTFGGELTPGQFTPGQSPFSLPKEMSSSRRPSHAGIGGQQYHESLTSGRQVPVAVSDIDPLQVNDIEITSVPSSTLEDTATASNGVERTPSPMLGHRGSSPMASLMEDDVPLPPAPRRNVLVSPLPSPVSNSETTFESAIISVAAETTSLSPSVPVSPADHSASPMLSDPLSPESAVSSEVAESPLATPEQPSSSTPKRRPNLLVKTDTLSIEFDNFAIEPLHSELVTSSSSAPASAMKKTRSSSNLRSPGTPSSPSERSESMTPRSAKTFDFSMPSVLDAADQPKVEKRKKHKLVKLRSPVAMPVIISTMVSTTSASPKVFKTFGEIM